MKHVVKKVMVLGFVLGMSGVGFVQSDVQAASKDDRPSDVLSSLLGRTAAEIQQLKVSSGKTYGTIANDEGVLEAFKSEMLEARKLQMQDRVDNGTMSQAEADAIIQQVQDRQAVCDGTGTGIGQGAGQGLGDGSGAGMGQGAGQGLNDGTGSRMSGRGNQGQGIHLQDGSGRNK